MDSLFINFIRRAVVVPLVAAVITVAVLVTIGPRAVAKTGDNLPDSTEQVATLDLTEFSLKSYKKFKQLKPGDLVATVECENISLGETAVVYDSSDKNNAVMHKASVEPWDNNGGVLFIGANTSDQFKQLHLAEVGEKFTVSFYDNEKYTYKLKKIIPSEEAKNLTSYIKDNTLVLCLQYNDFKDLGNSYYYQVFIAEKV